MRMKNVRNTILTLAVVALGSASLVAMKRPRDGDPADAPNAKKQKVENATLQEFGAYFYDTTLALFKNAGNVIVAQGMTVLRYAGIVAPEIVTIQPLNKLFPVTLFDQLLQDLVTIVNAYQKNLFYATDRLLGCKDVETLPASLEKLLQVYESIFSAANNAFEDNQLAGCNDVDKLYKGLHELLKTYSIPMLKAVLQEYFKQEPNLLEGLACIHDQGGNTVVHIAACYGAGDVVELLFKMAGTRAQELVFMQNKAGVTALHLAVDINERQVIH